MAQDKQIYAYIENSQVVFFCQKQCESQEPQQKISKLFSSVNERSRTAASAYQEPNKYAQILEQSNLSGADQESIVSKDIEAISSALKSYQDALNTASVEDALALYTQDGVFMPQHAEAFVGIDNVRKAYEGFFAMIKFDVKFEIKEIIPVAPDWAVARTNSTGKTDIRGRGAGYEANQDLFVFQKLGAEWRIARYCFSTTNPRPKW